MADTKHAHAPALPVEGDGVSYSGIGWFVVILAAVSAVCMALVWGMFLWMETRVDASDPPRAPLAAPALQQPAGPTLEFNLNEPGNLSEFRAREAETLSTYGWVDRNAGTVRIPIDQAKERLLQQGLPTRK
jgi:hypothetical protein